MSKRTARGHLRRFLYFRRRALAVLASVLVVFATVSALQPERTPLVTVVAAARDLPGGTTLSDADVTTVRLPPDAVPSGAAAEASALVGRTLNGPLSARSPVTEAAVASGQSLARPGFVVVALPLTNDALAPLVRPGARIDLLFPDDKQGAPVAADVRVVAAPAPQSGGLLPAASDRAVLIEVTPEVATRLATSARSGGLAIALR